MLETFCGRGLVSSWVGSERVIMCHWQSHGERRRKRRQTRPPSLPKKSDNPMRQKGGQGEKKSEGISHILMSSLCMSNIEFGITCLSCRLMRITQRVLFSIGFFVGVGLVHQGS